mmetsp:Transcript_16392/g.42339  ORF Transcript_16392/g.42339 Transcript_16392/m.42339 type:complete len:229 (-) Transcript_16392:145-831(-)
MRPQDARGARGLVQNLRHLEADVHRRCALCTEAAVLCDNGRVTRRTSHRVAHVEVLEGLLARRHLGCQLAAVRRCEDHRVPVARVRRHLHHEHGRARLKLVTGLLPLGHHNLDLPYTRQLHHDEVPAGLALRHHSHLRELRPEAVVDALAGLRIWRQLDQERAVRATYVHLLWLALRKSLRHMEPDVQGQRRLRAERPRARLTHLTRGVHLGLLFLLLLDGLLLEAEA